MPLLLQQEQCKKKHTRLNINDQRWRCLFASESLLRDFAYKIENAKLLCIFFYYPFFIQFIWKSVKEQASDFRDQN